jgi:HEAT repeat protein/Flp pilus assembly protein TadD
LQLLKQVAELARETSVSRVNRGKIMPKTRGKYIDELLDELVSLKSKPDAASKIKNSIDKIGNLDDKKAIPFIMPYLDHKTDYVRASAVYSLEKIRNNKELPRILINKLEKEESTLVRTAIIESLGELEDISAIPVLEAIKNGNEDDRIKITAIFAIDRLTKGETSAMKQLVDYLVDSRNPNTRVEAAKALGKLGDPRAIKYLIEALDDEKIFVRKFIVKALVSFGDKQVVDPVIKVFTDEKLLIDRDFINILWTFPEYKGKELWEIIDLRRKEKLNEMQVTDKGETPGHNLEVADTKIKEDYAYETGISSGRSELESSSQSSVVNADDVTASAPVPEQMTAEKDVALAKQELVPEPVLAQNKTKLDGKHPLQQVEDQKIKEFSDAFTKGERLYRKKQYYDALVNFKKAVEVKPDAWQAWYNMALVFYDVDEKGKSLECFKNALDFKPNEVDTMLDLASLHDEMGHYEDAIHYLVMAVKQSRFLPDAWLLLGNILQRVRRPEYALYCFNQVLQLSHNKRERAKARDKSESLIKKNPTITAKDPRKAKDFNISETTDLKFKL